MTQFVFNTSIKIMGITNILAKVNLSKVTSS